MLHDILRDTWAYQEIMQEGWQEGLQQGLQEGREEERQAELQRLRQVLMTIVQKQFPTMAQLVEMQAEGIHDPDVLQRVMLNVLAAQTDEQVTQALPQKE